VAHNLGRGFMEGVSTGHNHMPAILSNASFIPVSWSLLMRRTEAFQQIYQTAYNSPIYIYIYIYFGVRLICTFVCALQAKLPKTKLSGQTSPVLCS
jgi:hypothetical protein